MFLINIPVPSALAFNRPEFVTRTTFRLLAYCKKLAALKKSSKLLESGLPNVSTKFCSLDIVTISSTGPCLNSPANAPIDVDTAGMTLVKSISCTRTPGDTWNAIGFSS